MVLDEVQKEVKDMDSILLESLRILNQEFDNLIIDELKKYGVQLPEDISRVELVRLFTMDRNVETVCKCYVDGRNVFDIGQTTQLFFKGGFRQLEKKYFITNRMPVEPNPFEKFILNRFERKE